MTIKLISTARQAGQLGAPPLPRPKVTMVMVRRVWSWLVGVTVLTNLFFPFWPFSLLGLVVANQRFILCGLC